VRKEERGKEESTNRELEPHCPTAHCKARGGLIFSAFASASLESSWKDRLYTRELGMNES